MDTNAPPNKPMHPTADTEILMFSKGVARRVIGGVMPDARLWMCGL
jgi:hypothetical protein